MSTYYTGANGRGRVLIILINIYLGCRLQECCDKYFTAGSLNTLFETIVETCTVEFPREVGFFYHILYHYSFEPPPDDLMQFVNFN